MADVEKQTQSEETENSMILDKTASETNLTNSSALPLAKTLMASRPTSEQPPQSPTDSDSGSDYSQYQSPATSRPASLRPQDTDGAFEDVPLEEKAQYQESPMSGDLQAEVSSEERPEPIQTQSEVPAAEGIEEIPQSPTYSGSDYSEPSTPKTSRPNSTHAGVTSESITLEDSTQTPTAARQSQLSQSPSRTLAPQEEEQQTPIKTPSQQWNSLGQSSQCSRQSALEVDTSSSRPESLVESSALSSEPETPKITVSPLSQSPEGSDCSGSPPTSPKSPNTPTVPLSPMTPQEAHMSIDSLQSIALSESSLDYDHLSADQVEDVLATPRVSGVRHTRKVSSLEILQYTWGPPARQSTLFDTTKDEPLASLVVEPEEHDSMSVWRSESSDSLATPKRNSGSSESDVELDWSALDKNEEQEKEDKDLPAGVEDASTAFLLARLEQENAKFTADPKSAAGAAMNNNVTRVRGKSRPPSMAHLKKLVSQQDAPSIRYSLASDVEEQLPLEEPPPMTELEFWAALVQDYPSTASRLPTLTATKIRAGIPPPLRAVVWTSMSGARDRLLEEAFENLQNEQSPYEGIINKDVGRSFPGVELFRDAEGEGQKMLGRVLKCFSLHDKDIGYCQGLGFLVGPLLMNMGEKEAFCVLVR